MKVRGAVLAVLVLSLAALPALAASVTYNVSGNVGGGPVTATVTFTSSNSTSMTVEIQNTSANIVDIQMVLDGLTFAMPGSTLSLSGVQDTGGFENCVKGSGSGANCTFSAAGATGPDGATSPFGWQLSQFYQVLAGNGGLHPYGIVNSSVQNAGCVASCDGISNAQHNPYLIDAIFSFTGTGINLNNLGSIDTVWGTNFADTITTTKPGGGGPPPPPPVPEPATLGLLGSGLISVAALARKKLKK